MVLWSSVANLLSEALLSLTASAGGSLGLGIFLLSLGTRLALLPLTLRLAERARARQRAMEALRPELEALRASTAPESLPAVQLALYRQRGLGGVDAPALLGGLVQAPLGAGLYSAVRGALGSGKPFLWIADLARPDAWLALGVVGLGMLGAALYPQAPQAGRLAQLLLPGLITAAVLWHLSSGLALSWAASSAVGVVQAGLLRRRATGRG